MESCLDMTGFRDTKIRGIVCSEGAFNIDLTFVKLLGACQFLLNEKFKNCPINGITVRCFVRWSRILCHQSIQPNFPNQSGVR